MRTRAGAERAFAPLFESYLAGLRERGFSKALQERAARVLPLLFADGRRDVRFVGPAQLTAFALQLARTRNTRTGELLSQATQRLYMLAVPRFFAFLKKRSAILEDPGRDLICRKTFTLPRRVLSEAQARRLVTAPSPFEVLGRRDRAILETLYGTGIRRGECVRLDVTDVDLAQQLVFVRNGKGKKDRMVPLTGRAAAALDAYLADGRPELVRDSFQAALFLSSRGGRLSASRLNRLVKQHARSAGIVGPVFPHSLRHSYATHLLQGRAGVRQVQELLGHRSLETTTVYTRVVLEDLREVLERSHPREWAWRRARRRGRS